MGKTGKIMRSSIYTFLQKYQLFSSVAALLAFPYALSVLLSQAFISWSSLPPPIYSRLRTLFDAAGFPPSQFFNILNQKLSETISSSIFVLPFSLSFLLITKAAVIQALNQHKSTSVISLFNPLLVTYIWNSFLILSVNATVFCLLSFAFNFLEGFGISSAKCLLILSAAGAVLYSIVLANALIICNLALVSSGMEKCGGYMAILKACVLIQGRTSTALSLALPVNLTMAAIEALFQYRVIKAYRVAERLEFPMIFEGVLIAYLYSIFVVLDTIVNILLFKSLKTGKLRDLEGKPCCWINNSEEENGV